MSPHVGVASMAVQVAARVAGVRPSVLVDSKPPAALLTRRGLATGSMVVATAALVLALPSPADSAPLFGPRAVKELSPSAAPEQTPADAVRTLALATSPADAVAALLNGRDALLGASRVVGAAEGKRALLISKLPRMSSAVQVMTAVLPVVFDATLDGGDAASPLVTDQAAREGAYEDVLIGAKNVVLMSRIAQEREFTDEEVPQLTFTAALGAIDALIASLPSELLASGARARCRAALTAAQDTYENFMDAADGVACEGAL